MELMSGDGSIPISIKGFTHQETNPNPNPSPNPAPVVKKKRNLPGTPDPDAEVIALSPKTLMATNRFFCEICAKGFQRDQNLQLHRRGHNLPWKLRQRTSKEVRKKVYICPEESCVHHDPSRALGDLTGIKKHFSRKHGEKKWKCERCSKKYAVRSDWKAHSKTCGTREYKCDCGTLFSRKDSFITHRAFCDALTVENARLTSVAAPTNLNFRPNSSIYDPTSSPPQGFGGGGGGDVNGMSQFSQALFHNNGLDAAEDHHHQNPRISLWLNHQHQANSNAFLPPSSSSLPELMQMAPTNNIFGSSSSMVDFGGCMQQQHPFWHDRTSTGASLSLSTSPGKMKEESQGLASLYSSSHSAQAQQASPAHMSATALLQKAAQMGSTRSSNADGNADGNPNPNTNASFFGGFGILSSSGNDNGNATSYNGHLQQENLNDLMHSISRRDGVNLRNLDRLMMARGVKQGQVEQLKLQGEVEHSLTRDFLGVGGDAGRPFLQQELARFASMEDLSHHHHHHYNGNQ